MDRAYKQEVMWTNAPEVELARVSRDPAGLEKAIRIVDRLVREANGKQKGKGSEETLAA